MVSVIIPTTIQGFTHIARLIPALSLEPDIEIIVVDNGSHDGTTNFLSNYDCKIIVNKANLGFSKGVNQGARIAQGEYLLILNNDTMISQGFIKEMVKTFDMDEKIGVVGCLIMQLGGSEKKVQNAGVMFTQDYIPYELGLEQGDITPQLPFNDPRVHTVREVPGVTGACLMVKKSIWNEVGGLDEEYINGWEDNDFCLKVRELGYKIYYTGKTYISHLRFGSKSAGRFNHETANRQRYDNIWVHTKRAENILKGFREA